MRTAFRARYVFPVDGPPIPDGLVVVDGRQIVAVGRHGASLSLPPQQTRDLGNVAILPGLVNAHAHLDFSNLTSPLGTPGIDLADWIRRVMDYRRHAEYTTDPVTIGLDETLRCGVTTLAEIAQPGWSIDPVANSPLGITVFQELIAPTADRVADAWALAAAHVDKGAGSADWQPGLSPHAPYTVHPRLLNAVIGLSADKRVPVAMHLAESREELELLQQGTGPLRTLLEEVGAWDSTTIRPGARPIEYLRLLVSAHRTLVIHGNYLDDEEIGFLGANAARMTVVYCPRTHDWFRHDPYPLEKMHAAGVAVALGTDGRGSSPDLSLLAEMRFVARRHPAVSLHRILRMGTILGAKALGRQNRVGSLEPGKQANLLVVALPDGDATDPHELLLHSEQPIVACYCNGREINASLR